jgi:polyhydroxybutyrate depolymerase
MFNPPRALKRASLVLLIANAACGSEANTPVVATDASTPPLPAADSGQSPPSTVDAGPSTQDAGAPEASAPACAGKALQPIDSVRTIRSSGRERTMRVHVPKTYDKDKPTPVVLMFHGFLSTAAQQEEYSNLSTKADAEGFVAVYPQGVSNSWNGGACCGDSARDDIDDVKFIGDLLDNLESDLCVDKRRIFASGMSNGGFMTQRLGCDLSSRIAAIAPVAGVLLRPTCVPSRPVPILEFHGTKDTIVPYGGNGSLDFPTVKDTFAGWAKRNNCTGAAIETEKTKDSRCTTYSRCDADTVLCIVEGGGHTWPGAAPIAGTYTSPYLNATDEMWAFFKAHPMP